PSFDVNAPPHSLVPSNEPDIIASRQVVIRNTLELRQLTLGPRERVYDYDAANPLSQLTVVLFGIARNVPIDGEITFSDFSAATGLAKDMRKVVRHAIMQCIFCEPRPGVVTHTAASCLLAEDADLAAWMQWGVDNYWPTTCHACEAMARRPGSEELNETGFVVVNNTNLGLFD
ncbi:hypothetical protein K445DRAFT_43673, partial [Daldinia sp. EC12]